MKYLCLVLILFISCSTPKQSTTKYNLEWHKAGIYPRPNEFVPVEEVPQCNMAQLKNNVVYPKMAISANTEGNVIVRLLVDIHGKVVKPEILQSDSKIFNDSAIEAVKKTKWKPAIQNGKPINCWVTVPIRFQLED